jgi:DNA topoisomerase-1
MEKLLIVESPGKIKKISEYLGDGYIVMASIGHIIDLDEKTMSIDLKTFEPEYKIYDDKKEVVSKLIRQANKVGKDNILLAADEDREGEMIAWSLAKELKLKNPQRIVFNSITAKELKNAVANPKTIDYNMVKAQQARRILDRFAGYLLSPLLFKSGFKGAQSAGRVQSVVVKIIVDKEKEIISFFNEKKDTYFYINCNINYI